jgi:hypothetical protein
MLLLIFPYLVVNDVVVAFKYVVVVVVVVELGEIG